MVVATAFLSLDSADGTRRVIAFERDDGRYSVCLSVCGRIAAHAIVQTEAEAREIARQWAATPSDYASKGC